MLTVTAVVYNSFKKKLIDNSTKIDFSANTMKISLHTSSYTPSIDNHDFWDDVSATEVSASGTYSSGGFTLASLSVTQDNTDDEGVFDAADPTATSTTITARYAILYKSTGTASTSPLVCYWDFGADVTSQSDNFGLTFNSEGVLNVN